MIRTLQPGTDWTASETLTEQRVLQLRSGAGALLALAAPANANDGLMLRPEMPVVLASGSTIQLRPIGAAPVEIYDGPLL